MVMMFRCRPRRTCKGGSTASYYRSTAGRAKYISRGDTIGCIADTRALYNEHLLSSHHATDVTPFWSLLEIRAVRYMNDRIGERSLCYADDVT